MEIIDLIPSWCNFYGLLLNVLCTLYSCIIYTFNISLLNDKKTPPFIKAPPPNPHPSNIFNFSMFF